MKRLYREIIQMLHCTRFQLLALLSLALACLIFPVSVQASSTEEQEARSFVQSVAATVYGLAWPTATYESFKFKSLDRVSNGNDIRVKLSGTSSFGGGDLWMEIVLELRNGTLNDVHVANHNALLAPPFATSQAIGELVAELAEETFGDQQQPSHLVSPPPLTSGSSGSRTGFPFYVKNNCRHPVRIAIHYRQVNGQWHSEYWWTFDPGQSSYLASDGTRLLTNNSIFYYYAEAQDGSFYWNGGQQEFSVGGRNLAMVKAQDSEGDLEFTLSCPGR